MLIIYGGNVFEVGTLMGYVNQLYHRLSTLNPYEYIDHMVQVEALVIYISTLYNRLYDA